MSRLFPKLMLVVSIGIIGLACLGYYSPADARSRDGYTTVTVTNRGQNGYPDHVVRQRVRCWSQYYDGYRQRTARC